MLPQDTSISTIVLSDKALSSGMTRIEFNNNNYSLRAFYLDDTCSAKLRQSLEKMGYYFAKEKWFWFGHTFVASDTIDHEEDVPFVFIDKQFNGKHVVGGGGFRKIQYEQDYPNIPENKWQLKWVWLHPFLRHRHTLLDLWPAFIERLGEDFGVCEYAMNGVMFDFLQRNGTEFQKGIMERHYAAGRILEERQQEKNRMVDIDDRVLWDNS